MRDTLELKIKTIKHIQGMESLKYRANSTAHFTASCTCCNTCRNTIQHGVDETPYSFLGQAGTQIMNGYLQIIRRVT